MRYRPIIVVALLIVGGISLWLLEDMPQELQAQVAVTPRPVLYLVADVQRQFERIALVATRVSVEEENRLGEQIARHVQFPVPSDDPAFKFWQDRISQIGARLAEGAERKGIDYEFHYIPDGNFVNAFALPGGQIFFGKGMLDLMETEDELAAILGHEISHADRRHCIERYQYEYKARKLGLDMFYRLASIPVAIFQSGYTKEQELEADRAGLQLAVAAGYSPAGGLTLFEKFAQFSRGARDDADSPLQEVARIPLQSLQEYFRSHPPPLERRAALEQVIASHPRWQVDQPQRPLKFPEPGDESVENPAAP